MPNIMEQYDIEGIKPIYDLLKEMGMEEEDIKTYFPHGWKFYLDIKSGTDQEKAIALATALVSVGDKIIKAEKNLQQTLKTNQSLQKMVDDDYATHGIR